MSRAKVTVDVHNLGAVRSALEAGDELMLIASTIVLVTEAGARDTQIGGTLDGRPTLEALKEAIAAYDAARGERELRWIAIGNHYFGRKGAADAGPKQEGGA